jgi:hypothetical protein
VTLEKAAALLAQLEAKFPPKAPPSSDEQEADAEDTDDR